MHAVPGRSGGTAVPARSMPPGKEATMIARQPRWTQSIWLLGILAIGLVALGGCQPSQFSPLITGTVPTSTAAGLESQQDFQSPVEVPTQEPTVTPQPTPTIPPVPIPLPTPKVTPVPVATPPFLPGLADKPVSPYRIVFRRENTLWVVGNNGADPRVLFDAPGQLGLYMRVIPWANAESPGLWSASPDGTRLALPLFAQEKKESSSQQILSDIYLLDLSTGDLRRLIGGGAPVWSPTGDQIAYIWEGKLWAIDVATGKEREIMAIPEGYMIESDLTWSPDGSQIAFSYQEASLGGIPDLRVVRTDGSQKVDTVVPRSGLFIGKPRWLAGGRQLLYVARSARQATWAYFYDLQIVDLATRAVAPLTVQASVSSFALAPSGGEWVAFSGNYPYEKEMPPQDLWLANVNTGELVRLTGNPAGTSVYDLWWSPDGTQIVFQQGEQGIWTIDLRDGHIQQVYPGAPGLYYYDMVVLGGAR